MTYRRRSVSDLIEIFEPSTVSEDSSVFENPAPNPDLLVPSDLSNEERLYLHGAVPHITRNITRSLPGLLFPPLEVHRQPRRQRAEANIMENENANPDAQAAAAALLQQQQLENANIIQPGGGGAQVQPAVIVTNDEEGEETDDDSDDDRLAGAAGGQNVDIERLVRRLSTGSGVQLESDVAMLLRNITIPVWELSDPDPARDNIRIRDRTKNRLDRITSNEVLKALGVDFSKVIGPALSKKFHDIDKKLAVLSENSTSRISEKTDAVLPLKFYPLQDASEELYAKAVGLLSNAIKMINSHVSFVSSPFDWVFELLSECNSLASNFHLSEKQQIGLILSHIPAYSDVYNILNRAENIYALYEIVSAYSTRTHTRLELESSLNKWTMKNTSQSELNNCVSQLIYLTNKSDPKVSDSVLFQRVASRLLRENLPGFMIKNISEFLVKIRPDDKIAELNKTLLGILAPLVGTKMTGGGNQKPHVNAIESGGDENHYLRAITYGAHVDTAPKIKNRNKNRNKNKNNIVSQVQGVQTFQNTQNTVQAIQGAASPPAKSNLQGGGGGGKKPRSYFVKPWPSNQQYKGPNGGLNREINNHFQKFCTKCGNSGHKGPECRTYEGEPTVLSLCTNCWQGFHRTCKSKRPDLLKAKSKKVTTNQWEGLGEAVRAEIQNCFREGLLNLATNPSTFNQ
jgi:hypothetical protein